MGTVDQGVDTYCVDSIVTGRLARGVEIVGQRCYRRLITPPGSLAIIGIAEEDADFGLDLASYVGSVDSAELEALLPVRVQNELLKDPAVDAVDVTVVSTTSAGEVSWTITITITTTDGDVQLIVGVSGVTVELLGMS